MIKQVLLVEDVPVAQTLATLMLQTFGYRVALAQDGRAALHALKQQVFDCVLMDIGLPDISGIEVTRIFREEHRNHTTPVIALTAHDDLDYRTACARVGMNDFLVKPLTVEALSDVLPDALTQGV